MTWKVLVTRKPHADFPSPPQEVIKHIVLPEGLGSLIILPVTNKFKPDTFELLVGTDGEISTPSASLLTFSTETLALVFSGHDRYPYGSSQSTKLASLFLLDGSMMSACWRIICVSSVHEA